MVCCSFVPESVGSRRPLGHTLTSSQFDPAMSESEPLKSGGVSETLTGGQILPSHMAPGGPFRKWILLPSCRFEIKNASAPNFLGGQRHLCLGRFFQVENAWVMVSGFMVATMYAGYNSALLELKNKELQLKDAQRRNLGVPSF